MTEATVELLVGTGSLAQALVDAQAKMPAVKKDDENPHFNSRFMSLDNLIAETRGVLNAHGLAIVQFPVTNELGAPVLRTTIMHGASGETLTGDTPLFLPRQDMQAFGAAVTYARRYAWAAVLGIAAEDDDDGNSAGQAEQKPPATTEPPVKPASNAQKAKMGALVKHLDADQLPFPAEYVEADSWVDVLKARLKSEYGVQSRKDLTMRQASDLIDWLEEMTIPF